MYLVGLNLNLAPVLDVSPIASGGVMAYRSFGHDPSLVSLCGAAAIQATQSENVMATAKHFPGLGRARKDPHYALPVIAVSKDKLENYDLPPFRAAIRANVACVMTCHTLYPALDPERPGTFSPVIIHDLLRDQLGFNGVVITDDLDMGAVGDTYSPGTAAVAALTAGVDLLLVCNDFENMYETATAVRDGLERGLLEPQSLQLSLRRVENLRKTYLQRVNLADLSAVATYFST
jgi:beta-N-acetylhexosaminidase